MLALCGVLAGLGAALMLLGGLLGSATYCAPLLASLVLIPVQEECGGKAAWGVFAATALLSLLLCADKEAALIFLVLGYYPVIKFRLDAVRPGIFSRLCKLALFNAAIAAVYALLLLALTSEALFAELSAMNGGLLAALLLGGNAVFWLYDVLLARLWPLYRVRLQPALRRIFR